MSGNEPITKFMATKLITFTPETEIWEAIRIIVKNKISGAPVVNAKGDLIGMLSEVDCIRVVMEGPYNNQPGGLGKVGDFMTRTVTTIDSKGTIMDAAYSFTHSAFHRFPVLENGRLVGQISRSDILQAISKLNPKIKVVPDSWKPRIPILRKSKQGRYTENA